MSNFKVAVLGSGAASAYAVRAALDCGADVTVHAFADKPGGGPPGAFYLHWLPPSVANKTRQHDIFIHGTGMEIGYRTKQWGDFASQVSSSSFPTDSYLELGYDPIAINVLAAGAKRVIIDKPLTDREVDWLRNDYDIIFQTFPTQASLSTQPPYLKYYIVLSGIGADPDQNYIEYDGTHTVPWVRLSQLWGKRYLEFPKGMSWESITEWSSLWANSLHVEVKDFHPDTEIQVSRLTGVSLIGRWATWNKRWLSHMAYDYVVHKIKLTQGVQNEPATVSGLE